MKVGTHFKSYDGNMDYYYDYGLVALSFALAAFASFSALGLASRIPHICRKKVPAWFVGGAIAMGLGIWSMHFVGMLAFHLPIPLAYDQGITTLSILIAILSSHSRSIWSEWHPQP